MKRAELKPTRDAKRCHKMPVSWDAGESFDVALRPTAKLQPRTLIMYFPALAVEAKRPAHLTA